MPLRISKTRRLVVATLAALAVSPLPAQRGDGGLLLHVPSPDWRDQVIYFVMTDRFADGDPKNNDQGAGEYNPADRSRFSGGDLAGLRQRLDYIQGLGATAVWVTPPVANQWLSPDGGYGGYHGYWAQHFKQVDPHLGTLDDYRRLSDALHRRGMYLVQDVVVNHVGNFFTYRERWREGDPAHGWEAHDRSPPVPRPTQAPFDQNDPRDPAQRAAGIYHWTPDVRDYDDERQLLDFQMSGLDDLNTENPAVRRALRESFGFWIREAGVDALRIDTAFYVPASFFADFLHATDPQAPGVDLVARATGRTGLHVFGEGFGIDRPFDDTQARRIERYASGPGREGLLPAMINFPLYGTLGDVFARGRPTAELAHRIESMMKVHRQPHLMPSFVDNHDVDRFLAGGSEAALRQSLLAIFTLPGIPTIYYGTEQGFTQPRASMFAAGWGSGGRDRFDTAAPLYRAIAGMAELRRQHRVLSRGTPELLRASAAGPGALAWRMRAEPGSAGQGGTGDDWAIVAFNTSERQVLLEHLATGLPAGTRLAGRFGLDGKPADLTTDARGAVTLVLPPRAGLVWTAGGAGAGAAGSTPQATGSGPSIDPPAAAGPASDDFELAGSAAPGAHLRLVVDGDVSRAVSMRADERGRWRARVDTSSMIDPGVEHRAVAWDEQRGAASQAHPFRVERRWQQVAAVDDPAGDDAGPSRRYVYPTDPSWGDNRQMDIRRVEIWRSGGALRIDVQLHRLTRSWSPANGFDHVALTVFLELAGQPPGSEWMPLQNDRLPDGMRWHRRLRVHGWSNALFDATGADATSEGTPIAPAARVSVDESRQVVSLVLPAAALRVGAGTASARVYVNTWDYDGGYRRLTPQPGTHHMGGGQPGEPLWMDDAPIITVPGPAAPSRP